MNCFLLHGMGAVCLGPIYFDCTSDLMGVKPDESRVITTNGTLGSCFCRLNVCIGFASS